MSLTSVIEGQKRLRSLSKRQRQHAFHAVTAAATENALSPSVIRRIDGTRSVDVERERRRRRKSTSDDRWNVSARYWGALWWRQRQTSTHKYNFNCSGTSSQWS